ncbi:MAG: hypothetical protein JW928_09505, partial [Candidatus Aureabacteria bacterium]|nr:hypothetical protein [Candidatus Auribacterota bacterium]
DEQCPYAFLIRGFFVLISSLSFENIVVRNIQEKISFQKEICNCLSVFRFSYTLRSPPLSF